MPRQPVEYPSGVSIDGRPNIYLAEGNKPFPSPMMDAQLPREGSGREGLGEASSPGSRLLSSPGWAIPLQVPAPRSCSPPRPRLPSPAQGRGDAPLPQGSALRLLVPNPCLRTVRGR